MRTDQTEQIMFRAPGFSIMNRGVMRAKWQQTDQGKNDQEKTKDADDFFAHKLVRVGYVDWKDKTACLHTKAGVSCSKTRNSNIEKRNKFEYQMSECPELLGMYDSGQVRWSLKNIALLSVLDFEFLSFDIVSSFGFRISKFCS